MIPAILTSLMSYISYTSIREDVQHAIAAYIASTIVGGSLGRLLSGVSTELLGWRFFFFLLGIGLMLIFFLLGRLQQDVNTSYSRPSLREVAELVREGKFLWLYMGIFSLFFVFSAMMNFLPFELKEVHPEAGESGTGFLYIGYAMGIVVSLRTRTIISFFGSEVDAARAGILLFFAGTSLFFYETVWSTSCHLQRSQLPMVSTSPSITWGEPWAPFSRAIFLSALAGRVFSVSCKRSSVFPCLPYSC